MLVADLLIEFLMNLWWPPERLLSRTWAAFKHRSAPLRAIGVVLCALIVLGSLAFWLLVLCAVIGLPIWLLLRLL